MSKKKDGKYRIPRKVLGFKLSKGSRKDLRRLLKLIEGPEARAIAISAASIAFGYLAEKTAKRKGLLRELVGTDAAPAQPN